MNIGIIDIGWKSIDKDSFTKQALGGSETWLLSVTRELAKQNHEVTVYCSTKDYWSTDLGVGGADIKFVPLYNIVDNFLDLSVKNHRYDFMILNRVIHRFGTDIITLIRQYNVTDNIFLQMHDLSLLYEEHLATENELRQSGIFDPRVRGIVFLTKWHAENFDRQYPVLSNIPKYIIPNGVDLSLIPQNKKETDNRILWSSCAERGLDILIDMYDDIKKEIPDFGIDVAGYNDLSRLNVGDRDIRILGNLSKERLYQEMNKHKVWFYPGTFAETFCITLVENLACGNLVISPFTYGTRDVVSYQYKTELWNKYGQIDEFKDYIIPAKHKATVAIVKTLKNYDSSLADKGRRIADSYTWEDTASKYLGLYEHLMYRVEPGHVYKGIFLSQSCNNDFFAEESKLVEETWAKDLIDNKYPGYTYFRYTSCDKDHPDPCIDGHTIYVLNDDSLKHTYEKMRDAYRLLLMHGYTFDNIFRTNTSTYINVNKAIEAMETCRPTEIKSDICGYYHVMPGGTRTFQFNCFVGNAYIMSKYLADRVFLSNYNSSISTIPDGDDIITNMIVNELTNPGEIQMTTLNPNVPMSMCYKFKHLIDPEHETDPEHRKRYIVDPNISKSQTTVSVRMKTLDLDERRKYGEFDHMRELHRAYAL